MPLNTDDAFAGEIVTVYISHTSAGATTETLNLPADVPKFDLTKPHPVISGVYICTEGDTAVASEVLLPENEGIRGYAVAEAVNGKWDIVDLDTIAFYLTANLDGIFVVTYWADGVKKT